MLVSTPELYWQLNATDYRMMAKAYTLQKATTQFREKWNKYHETCGLVWTMLLIMILLLNVINTYLIIIGHEISLPYAYICASEKS